MTSPQKLLGVNKEKCVTFGYNHNPRWGNYSYRNNRQNETLSSIKQQHTLVRYNTMSGESEEAPRQRVVSQVRKVNGGFYVKENV